MSKRKGKRPEKKAPVAQPETSGKPQAISDPPEPKPSESTEPVSTMDATSIFTTVQNAWKQSLRWLDISNTKSTSPPGITFSHTRVQEGETSTETDTPFYDVVSSLTSPQTTDPVPVVKRMLAHSQPEGLLVLLVNESADPRASCLLPVSAWVAACTSLSMRVAICFDERTSKFLVLASRDETHVACASLNSLAPLFECEGELLPACFLPKPPTKSWPDDSVVYLCNPSESLYSGILQATTSNETHPNLYLDDQKLNLEESRKAAGTYIHRWKPVALPPGGHRLSIRFSGESREGTFHLQCSPGNRVEFLQSLPFDHFQRYQLNSEILNTLLPDGGSVLDVGGARGYAQLFFDRYDVSVIDVSSHDEPNAIVCGNETLPWPDDAFDAVVSIDTLEHVPASKRTGFLAELCRVAKQGVLLSCPFNEDHVEDAESVLEEYLKGVLNRNDRFLQEHHEYGLPELAAVSASFEEKDWAVTGLPNGYLPRWLLMQMMEFTLGSTPELNEARLRLNALYNQHYYSRDNQFPAYRMTILATAEPLSEEKREALADMISYGDESSTGDLWNVASMASSMAQFRVLREKDGIIRHRDDQIEGLLTHIKNMEARLAESQSETRGLQEHTINLGTMLRQAQEQNRELTAQLAETERLLETSRQHALNLESLLARLVTSDNEERSAKRLLDGVNRLESQMEALTRHLQIHPAGTALQRMEPIIEAVVSILTENSELNTQVERERENRVSHTIQILQTPPV